MDHSIMNEAHRKFDMVLARANGKLNQLDQKNGIAKPAPKRAFERPLMPPPVNWK